ncbi:RNA-directed DNA polymerase, eukaryota [Tanacetum coccineum]
MGSGGRRVFRRVKTTREHIDQRYLPNDGMETRWNPFLPKKISIFIWRVLRDRLPTRWNLSRKGIDVDSLSCPVCDVGIETIQHSMISTHGLMIYISRLLGKSSWKLFAVLSYGHCGISGTRRSLAQLLLSAAF